MTQPRIYGWRLIVASVIVFGVVLLPLILALIVAGIISVLH